MNAGKKLLFPLFWKLAFFCSALFIAAFLALLFAVRAALSPLAERNMRVLTNEANYSTALMANTVLNTVKNDTQLFVYMLESQNSSAEQNALTYTFYKAHPGIAAVVIHEKNTPLSAARKIINIDLFNTRFLSYGAVDAFLNSRGYELSTAARAGGDIVNAYPAFNLPVLVYALPQSDGADYYCFFLAGDLPAAFETAQTDAARQAFLVNKSGAVLFHSDAALSRAAARFENESYVKELLDSGEKTGSRLVSGAADGRHFLSFRKLDSGALLIHTFPLYKPLEDINAAFIRGLCLGAAFLCAGLFILRLLSKTALIRLQKLTQAAQEIAAGNFDVRVKGGSVDELGRLGACFSRMITSIQSAASFTDTAVIRAFLRRELDESIVKKSAVIAHANIVNLADIKKNTSAAELGGYISAFISIVHECALKTKGTPEPFSGSMTACHWGCAFSSGSRNHDTMNAVRAVLMMRVAFIDFNRVQKKEKKPPLICSFSLDAGVVSAGIAGGKERREYTVFGNAVKNSKNTALSNDRNTADILVSEKIFLRIRAFIIAAEAPAASGGADKPLFAVINVRTAEGVTQPVPRNMLELKKLLNGDYEDTDGAS